MRFLAGTEENKIGLTVICMVVHFNVVLEWSFREEDRQTHIIL